ncbi:H2 subunit B [Seminavis robusta]|uniref:Ribonuclease H2 subunit B n=1 Tax=Seminavis robusta TaxID=568900 RepID=A0A9N8ET11_9STRA|nr:H2 subunit B [Seminavis robusta]|eukprot:Sro1601_g285180.1 H2 subunit B (375) ;mRNA; r:16532-17656
MTASSSTKSNGSRTSNKTENKLFVAIVDAPPTTCSTTRQEETYQPIRLKCPASGQVKDYLLRSIIGNNNNKNKNGDLLELQCLSLQDDSSPKQYNSWFVGNTVVSNGKLYVMTRIDPLFFCLPSLSQQTTTTTQPKKWQPLDQLLEDMDATVQQLLLLVDKRQLLHLCDTYEMDQDEVFYKFSQPKCLEWLHKKQQAVQKVLVAQLQAQQKRQLQMEREGGGAFAKDFSLTTTSTTQNTKQQDKSNHNPQLHNNKPSAQQQEMALRESCQIVCSYISQGWQTLFLKHVQQDDKILQLDHHQPKNKRVKETPVVVVVTAESTTAKTEAAPPPPKPKLTFGQKQLLKVNKKGMKSMTSFFAPKNKKTTTTTTNNAK